MSLRHCNQRSLSDDLLTARENRGFSTGLHYTLIHFITDILHSCFSYILHLVSVWLANLLANFNMYPSLKYPKIASKTG